MAEIGRFLPDLSMIFESINRLLLAQEQPPNRGNRKLEADRLESGIKLSTSAAEPNRR
jgi:hypothetical protein